MNNLKVKLPIERNFAIDTLRTLATILVIMLHVSAEYVSNGMLSKSFDHNFWFGNIIDSFCRICVPIFVMISGMFLVGRNESLKNSYMKRVSRILLPLIFWTCSYILYRLLFNQFAHKSFGIDLILTDLFFGRPFYHLWYLYMIIGLYAVIPVINNTILMISRRSLWIVAIFLVVFGFLNNGYDLITESRPNFLIWFINYLGYLILGYLLKDFKSDISNLSLLSVYILSGISISLLSFYTIKNFDNLYFYEYLNPLVIISAICVFMLFQQLNIKENIFSRISHLTLGIYVIHAGILQILVLSFRELSVDMGNVVFDFLFKFTVSLLLSTIIAFAFFKNRFLKRFI